MPKNHYSIKASTCSPLSHAFSVGMIVVHLASAFRYRFQGNSPKLYHSVDPATFACVLLDAGFLEPVQEADINGHCTSARSRGRFQERYAFGYQSQGDLLGPQPVLETAKASSSKHVLRKKIDLDQSLTTDVHVASTKPEGNCSGRCWADMMLLSRGKCWWVRFPYLPWCNVNLIGCEMPELRLRAH